MVPLEPLLPPKNLPLLDPWARPHGPPCGAPQGLTSRPARYRCTLVSVVEVFSEIQSTTHGGFARTEDGEARDSCSEEATWALPIPRTHLSQLFLRLRQRLLLFIAALTIMLHMVVG